MIISQRSQAYLVSPSRSLSLLSLGSIFLVSILGWCVNTFSHHCWLSFSRCIRTILLSSIDQDQYLKEKIGVYLRMVQVLSSTLISLHSSPSKIGSRPFSARRSFFFLRTTARSAPRVPCGTGTVMSSSPNSWVQEYGRARTDKIKEFAKYHTHTSLLSLFSGSIFFITSFKLVL